MSNLFKANEAGTDAVLKTGRLFDVNGMAIHQSAYVNSPAIGSLVASVNATGYPVGATDLTCTYTSGSSAIGDIITIGTDPNKYVVQNVLSGAGVLKIAAPGLRQAIPASAQTITTLAKSTQNMAFHSSAIQLLTRQPAMPDGGDIADDVFVLTDPNSGITFQIARYKQYRQVSYEVGLAWGVKLIKPDFAAILLGK
jgi:hypothetical protein